MNLNLLILLPFVTAIALLFCNGQKQVRVLALLGSSLQLVLVLILLLNFYSERAGGNNAQMLFESNYSWFAPLHINYHVGIDGISLAMIMLTALVVVSGVLVSWSMDLLTKEFFFLLIFLFLF